MLLASFFLNWKKAVWNITWCVIRYLYCCRLEKKLLKCHKFVKVLEKPINLKCIDDSVLYLQDCSISDTSSVQFIVYFHKCLNFCSSVLANLMFVKPIILVI